jgi:hypothetical protein
VPYLLNTFALNTTFLTQKSKSSIVTTNQTFFIRTTTIVGKQKKRLTKMNLITNKWSTKTKKDLANTHLQNSYFQKNNNTKWKLKSNTIFILMRKKINKHTTLSLVWDKILDQNPKLLLFFLTLTNFDYIVDWKLTKKKFHHGSTINLWFINEQGILWILIMQLMGTPEP